MFGPKSKTLMNLEHYLEVRPKTPHGISPLEWSCLAGIVLVSSWLVALTATIGIGFFLPAALATLGLVWFWSAMVHKKRQGPDHDLFVQADIVADRMRAQSARRRLHLVLHPGVAITLNECAGFWRRIHAASEPKLWKGADLQPHWADTRAEWLEAADVAMAEALILADSSINERAPRARAEELIEDILDTYVFSKRSQQEQHLPPAFVPLRTLAEKLATLASEVEGAQTALSAAPLAPPPTPIEAGRRLDQVLGNLRSIRQAEEELQQDIRS